MRASQIVGISLLIFGAAVLACGGDDDQASVPTVDGGLGASSSSSGGPQPDPGADADTDPPSPLAGLDPAPGNSCKGVTNGGTTCGPDGKDDCCKALPMTTPAGAVTLDKYNITAGRMRAFVTATNGNIRGWIQAHRPDWFESAWDSQLPIEMDSGEKTLDDNHLYAAGKGLDGVYQQLGPIHYGAAETGGNEGCLTSEVGNARTYWLPADVNKSLFNDVQEYAQDVLDKKPQQCTTFFMFAAFCAWDGGTLPTVDQLSFAYDGGDAAKHVYPWGNTPLPAGWSDAYFTASDAMSFGKVTPKTGDQTFANNRYNFFEPAKMLCLNDKANACDYSLYIAPPGRFPKGDGPFGHSDLVGNVYNVALPMTGPVGGDPTKRFANLGKTGAFDSPHPIPTARTPANKAWHPTNKYLAVGGRCLHAM